MNSIFLKYSSCLLLFLFLSLGSFAQSKTIVEIDGSRYYQHIVEPGNTLYAISKLYQVEEDVLIRYNPGIENGLSINQEILIPIEANESTDKWTNPIRIEGSFMIHRVKRKETLYGISKEYKVDVNDILENNAAANSGLNKGMELRIPINDVDEVSLTDDLSKISVLDTSIYVMHTVAPGETLYFLSRFYNVTIDEIKNNNEGLPEGLKQGTTIIIRPKTEEELADKIEMNVGELVIHRTEDGRKTLDPLDIIPLDSEIIKDSYGIALLLPLFTEESKGGSLPRKESKLQEIAYHFYEGVMIALDSLKEYGLSADVYVYDVNGNDQNLDHIFDLPEMQNIQLVIGPFQKKQVFEAAEQCRKRGIHMVCPVSQSNKLLVDFPNVSKAHPSSYTQLEMLAVDVSTVHKEDNIILINSYDVRDALMVKAFKDSYEKEMESNPEIPMYKEVRSSVKSVENISVKLDPNKNNVVIVPSKDKVAVQDVFTQLSRTSEKTFHITLYGIEKWWDYKFIDIDYKSRFNLSISTPQYVNYQNEYVESFVKSYKDKNNLEPSKYAFKGYDLATYYGRGLIQFGIAFPQYFEHIDQRGLLMSKFDYFQTEERNGYENKHIFILETAEGQIKDRSVFNSLPLNTTSSELMPLEK